MQWITKEDHRWKTFVDVRECRKEKRQQSYEPRAVLGKLEN